MKSYPKPIWALSITLAALAGFVDALGFLHLGGFFVSFMSGNSTRLGIGLALDWTQAALSAGLIFTFVSGVVVGTLVSFKTRSRTTALWFETTFLFGAALATTAHYNVLAILLMVMAMGCENTLFLRGNEVSIGLTYMTGTLVKVGQHVARALLGEAHWDWLPYLLLWMGLLAGGVVGAMMFALVGLKGLWIAASISAFCAVWATLTQQADMVIPAEQR